MRPVGSESAPVRPVV